MKPAQFAGQGLALILFAVFLGYFSANPSYTHVDPGKALIKLSLRHAGQRKGECRRLSPEEIAKLAPNMRRVMDCPRERVDVVVELALDGEVLFHASLAPKGLARDGASAVYQRFVVEPGRHHMRARLRDSNRAEGFDYETEADIDLRPGQNLAVDFRSDIGEFVFM